MAQIENDLELLNKWLEDDAHQSALWRVTRYWTYYMDMVTSAVKQSGLHDFRKNDLILSSFSTSRPSLFLRKQTPELDENNQVWGTHAGTDSKTSQTLPVGFKKFVSQHLLHLPVFRTLFKWFRIPNLAVLADEYFFATLRLSLDLSLRIPDVQALITRVSDSRLGQPADLIPTLNGNSLGFDGLIALHHLTFIQKALHNQPFKTILEIGGGYGCLCEMTCKTFPDLQRYIILDLPQTGYIATQYLKAVFPQKVLDYRDLDRHDQITETELGNKKIIVLPVWFLPRLKLRFDCFVNIASFQEMERSVIRNYMNYIEKLTQNIYLHTLTKGHGPGFTNEAITYETLAGILKDKGFKVSCADEINYFKFIRPLYTSKFFSKP